MMRLLTFATVSLYGYTAHQSVIQQRGVLSRGA